MCKVKKNFARCPVGKLLRCILNPFLVTFVAQEQTELERMVQELGGVLVQQKNAPRIFVATSVQSSEYKARPHDARDHSH